MARGNLAGIQLMRGVAASLVVVHHILLALNLSQGASPNSLLGGLVRVGACGVDIFFVISGFIMIHVAENKFGRGGAAVDFLFRRAIRIVPLYWFMTTVIFVGWFAGWFLRNLHMSAADVFCSYVFLPCVAAHGSPLSMHPLLDQGWTLSFEWYFYLVFALWMSLAKPRSLVIGAPFLFLIVIGITRWIQGQGPIHAFFSDTIVFEFCLGMGLAFAYGRGFLPARCIIYAAVLLGGASIVISAIMGLDLRVRWLFWGVPAALLVLGVLRVMESTSFTIRAFARLGDASYSLYLTHGLATLTLGHVMKERHDATGLWLATAGILVFFVSLIMAFAVHHLVERPINRKLVAAYGDLRVRSEKLAASMGA